MCSFYEYWDDLIGARIFLFINMRLIFAGDLKHSLRCRLSSQAGVVFRHEDALCLVQIETILYFVRYLGHYTRDPAKLAAPSEPLFTGNTYALV